MQELRHEIQNTGGIRVMHLLRVAADRQLTQEEMRKATANGLQPERQMRISFLSEGTQNYKGKHYYVGEKGYSVIVEKFTCVQASGRNQQYLDKYEERRYTKEGRLASRVIVTGYNLNSLRLAYTPPGALVGKADERQTYPRRAKA